MVFQYRSAKLLSPSAFHAIRRYNFMLVSLRGFACRHPDIRVLVIVTMQEQFRNNHFFRFSVPSISENAFRWNLTAQPLGDAVLAIERSREQSVILQLRTGLLRSGAVESRSFFRFDHPFNPSCETREMRSSLFTLGAKRSVQ
jgi:hypothetical protein